MSKYFIKYSKYIYYKIDKSDLRQLFSFVLKDYIIKNKLRFLLK